MQKNVDTVKRIFYVFLMLLFFKVSPANADNGFVIKSVNTQLNDSVYFLNAVFEIKLPDFIVSSFDQGIVLPLSMEVDIFKTRRFWLDKDVVSIKQQYRIQNHALLGSVSLLNVNSGNRLYFTSLNKALNHLTVLLGFPLLDNNTLIPGEHYKGRIRFGIDSAELPIPLKSTSFWKNNWDLVSDQYEWDITQ